MGQFHCSNEVQPMMPVGSKLNSSRDLLWLLYRWLFLLPCILIDRCILLSQLVLKAATDRSQFWLRSVACSIWCPVKIAFGQLTYWLLLHIKKIIYKVCTHFLWPAISNMSYSYLLGDCFLLRSIQRGQNSTFLLVLLILELRWHHAKLNKKIPKLTNLHLDFENRHQLPNLIFRFTI